MEKGKSFKDLGPEAKVYRTYLKETSTEYELPPQEDRETVKKTLKEVRGRRRIREAGRDPAELVVENEAKERMAELLERGEVTEGFLARLAILFDCEPWDALARLEKNPKAAADIFAHLGSLTHAVEKKKKIFDRGHAQESANELFVSQISLLQGEATLFRDAFEFDKETEGVPLRRRLYPHGTHGLVAWAQEGRPLFSYIADAGQFSDGPAGIKHSDFRDRGPFMEPRRGSKLPKGSSVMRSDQYADPVYWTIVNALVTKNPNAFGYPSVKVAERTIADVVTQIGTAFGNPARIEKGVWYFGAKQPKEDRLGAVDVARAKEIAQEYTHNVGAHERKLVAQEEFNAQQKALEAEARQQEKQSAEEARKRSFQDQLLELQDVNQRLQIAEMALAPRKGLIANVFATLRGVRDLDREMLTELRNKKRWLITELARNNRRRGKSLVSGAPRDAVEASWSKLDEFWSAQAEDAYTALTDEDGPRSDESALRQLEQMKQRARHQQNQ